MEGILERHLIPVVYWVTELTRRGDFKKTNMQLAFDLNQV
jgi:hypothetical protein